MIYKNIRQKTKDGATQTPHNIGGVPNGTMESLTRDP
jgi:hypothetical protein